ncbi:DUF3768 domain-containing protein [Jannaschia formosa]|nr:DUF3768 domain-containing protein [Jannaschia formosa]
MPWERTRSRTPTSRPDQSLPFPIPGRLRRAGGGPFRRGPQHEERDHAERHFTHNGRARPRRGPHRRAERRLPRPCLRGRALPAGWRSARLPALHRRRGRRGDAFAAACRAAVAAQTVFPEEDDPDGLHDFGAVEVAGRRVWWKIDLYADETLAWGSERPDDPARTVGVLTILFPEDW